MESDKVVVIKSRGPRRLGIKRSSIQGISVLPAVDPAAVDANQSDSANGKSDDKSESQDLNDSLGNDKDNLSKTDEELSDAVPMETDQSKDALIETNTMLANPTSEESDTVAQQENPSTDSSPIKTDESPIKNQEILPDNGNDEDSAKMSDSPIKDEPTNDVNSEDSDEFFGFQSAPSPVTKPILTKLIASTKMEIDTAEKSLIDNMDSNLATPEDDPKVSTKETKIGNGVGKKKKKDADGSFANIKLLSEVSSEVTSSNDVLNNTNDTYKGSDEISSEVTSSATNSPSLGSGGMKSPASASRPKRAARAQKSSVDISDPIFRKPFEFGWKRELVYRNSNDSSTRVQADIYYYAPSGKKVRSTREIVEHLYGTELTIENFTFFKEPVGIEDTEKEIIRIAKRVSSIGGGVVTTPKKLSTPKTPKPKDPVANTSLKVSPDSPEKASTSKGTSRGFPRIKITPSQLMRSSPGSSKGKGRGKKGQAADGELVMGMLPPNWSQPTTGGGCEEMSEVPAAMSPGKKRKRESEVSVEVASVKRAKKSGGASTIMPVGVSWPLSFPSLLATGYTAMLSVFQYLKVKELLRAARVCKLWRDLADHPSLWRVVRMKNSQVDDWEGFVTALVRHDTQQLDLRKMLLPTEQADIDTLWRSFLKEISRATGLVRIDLCRCPAYVVEELAAACPGLTVLNAVAIKCSTINLDSLANFANLEELRLKSMTGCHLTSNMDAFKSLISLKHLSLTTFKDLGQAGPEVLGLLTNLESLEIGECSDLDEDFSIKVLSNLRKMTSLRFEKGQGKTCPTFSLLAGVKELPALNQLELVNFDIKAGFSEALAQCTNIKRLLIIPTYVTQSATTNHMVLSAVTELKDTLSHLVWGVTNELLRVTELFIDQCDTAKDGNKNKTPKVPKSPDSIPIMKPESCKNDWDSSDSKSMSSPIGQVKILTLAKLQQVLVTQLPNTKIKILKVPFQSTWRQSISEPMT